jgi:TolB-like protein/class 3 adenylate cyclase/Tfp pilus assembly protein PilF
MAAKLKPDPHLEIAHVLFIDVVGYSKLLVNEQREVVQELNQVVRKTPQFRKSEAAGKLIRIPVGDGMALVFFQTPEEPVQCAMEIARTLKSHPHIRLRMGVHSGPVDQLKDVNDQTNVAGVGINVAQRVMSCGDAGHILLSKRVAMDLAQDKHWQRLLHELGEVELKHGEKVGIVNLYTEELGNPEPPERLRQGEAASTPSDSSSIASVSEQLPAVEKSIAVLPFESLSADPNNTFFADAIQDEILTDLSNVADLKVISRTSVMQYKTGVKRNLREIADELGVAHIVEGSVQPAGNRVRVRAQLIDARSDKHVWAERYDRPLDDVFAIQSDIAKAIAGQLQAKLSPAEKAAIEQPPTTNLLAYDRYLRAKKLRMVRTFDARERENNRQAIRMLEQAVAHDPTFLLAYCDLASDHAFQYFTGWDRTAARLALAEGALTKAVELAPDRGEPHLAAAWIAYQCYRDYDRALAEVATARQRLPNDPGVFALPGFIARRRGQFEQCTSNMERACELDPRSLWLLLQTAQTYWLLRRFLDMARFLDRALAVAPGDASTLLARALIDLESGGDSQPAYDLIQRLVAEDPSVVDALAEQWIYLAICQRDAAGMAQALASLSPEGIIPFNVRMPRSFCEGLAARVRGDASGAEKAFATTRVEMEKVLREQADYAEALSVLGMANAAIGNNEDALREGRRAAELLPVAKDAMTGAELLRNLAIIYAWSGKKDLAIQQLEALLPLYGPISYGQLRLHPWWDPLRDHPRFETIMEEAKKPVVLK